MTKHEVSVTGSVAGAIFCLLVGSLWVTVSADARAADGRISAGSVRMQGGLLSVSLHKLPLSEVLDGIEARSSLRFSLMGDVGKREISTSFERLSLAEGISRLLRGTNYAFIYSMEDGRARLSDVIVMPTEAQRSTEAGAPMPDTGLRRARKPKVEQGADIPVAFAHDHDAARTQFFKAVLSGKEKIEEQSDMRLYRGMGLALRKPEDGGEAAQRSAPASRPAAFLEALGSAGNGNRSGFQEGFQGAAAHNRKARDLSRRAAAER